MAPRNCQIEAATPNSNTRSLADVGFISPMPAPNSFEHKASIPIVSLGGLRQKTTKLKRLFKREPPPISKPYNKNYSSHLYRTRQLPDYYNDDWHTITLVLLLLMYNNMHITENHHSHPPPYGGVWRTGTWSYVAVPRTQGLVVQRERRRKRELKLMRLDNHFNMDKRTGWVCGYEWLCVEVLPVIQEEVEKQEERKERKKREKKERKKRNKKGKSRADPAMGLQMKKSEERVRKSGEDRRLKS
ncbi:MAG: hypothetical protein M1820_007608 [Bogoriella megaspora]|nr:MAG: hypothetical protein M1820_007608 [Bogoriella megaspora]